MLCCERFSYMYRVFHPSTQSYMVHILHWLVETTGVFICPSLAHVPSNEFEYDTETILENCCSVALTVCVVGVLWGQVLGSLKAVQQHGSPMEGQQQSFHYPTDKPSCLA